MTDDDLAADLAAAAGDLLMAIRTEGTEHDRALGKRGDHEANALLIERLRHSRPDDCILSEEAKDDLSRCSARRVWIIDPLDGTREYGEGREDWAVHVGLAIDGQPVCGAVALPARGRVFATGDEGAAPARPRDQLTIAVSRSRAPEIAQAVADRLGGLLLPMGSAGAKTMAVVAGDADCYLHAGGQYEWDNCAPVAVARAYGLHASRLDGSPLLYNCTNPSLPDLLICRPELSEMLLTAIHDIGSGDH